MALDTFLGKKVRFIVAVSDGAQMRFTEKNGKLKDADATGVEIVVTEADGKTKTSYYVSWNLLYGMREG